MTELPDGWRPASIGEVASVDSGPAFQSKLFGGPNEGTRLLRGDNIEPGALRWQRTRTWPDERLPGFESLLVEVGDIILAMDRPVITSGLKLGRVTPNDLPALLVQRVARIRATGVENGYLYHLLESRQFVHHLRGNQVGTQVPHITLKTIRDFPVPLPPINEQRRIVEILEDHLSRLDAAIALSMSAVRRLDALQVSGLWHATHGLPASEAFTLSGVAEVRLGRQRSPKNHTGDRMRPYLRAANVGWDELCLDDVKKMQFTELESATYELHDGDILLTEASGSASEVGKSAIYRSEVTGVCFQNTLLRVRCHEGVNPKFVQLYLLAEARLGKFVAESRGVGIIHLGRARLASWPVLLPTADLQIAAVKIASELGEATARTRETAQKATIRAHGLRRALLAAAFSGRLTGLAADQEIVKEMAGV